MKKLTTILLLLTTFTTFSQDWPLKKLVQDKKVNRVAFTAIPAFSFVSNKTVGKKGSYQELKLNPSFSKLLLQQKPEAIQISIPISSTKSITCDLVKFTLGNIIFTENDKDVIENVKVPFTYRGIIAGQASKNNVMLTVNEDYLSLTATSDNRILQITKANESVASTYRLYNSTQIDNPQPLPDCGTSNKATPTASNIGIDLSGATKPTGYLDKCVYVFVDCFDSVYIWKDTSTQKTINYVYELFNAVSTGYLNEQISIQITAINIWSTTGPYRHDKRENSLADLAFKWKDSFWGNLCVGLDYVGGRSGLAGGIGTSKGVAVNTCPSYKYSGKDSISACCYNDLNYGGKYDSFPTGPNTTQSQIYLVMHEMGHLLGSSHTQWCGWVISTGIPIVLGALDNCAPTEGGCPPGLPPPGGKGTIMSYCNIGGPLVSFNRGFGEQPGNAVRNYIDKNTCFPTCLVCTGLQYKPSNAGMQDLAGPEGNTLLKSNTALLLSSLAGRQPANHLHHLITNIKQ